MRIEHLTKIYQSGSTVSVGLDDVSFTLPDKGLVFIVGKSGSGKSTLLNMLGGLDEITSGDIVIGDNRFSEFSHKDYDNYRNSYLGFVFQDFCLIDELTVEDNVRLALDLQGEHDTDASVEEILENVELTEYAKRRPSQLSGGQRQRVAIARALVKSPKLILADEPTGNLDSKTAVQVLDMLKKLSREILVVVVSHNISDAENYADRIIELADGKIISDKSRRERGNNVFEITDDVVYIPDGIRMTDDEMLRLNEAVSTGNKRIVQRDTAFENTKEVSDSTSAHKFKSSHLSFKRTLSVSRHFLKKKLLSSILMVIMITAVTLLFGLSRVFVGFDGDVVMDEAMSAKESSVMVMRKGTRNEILDVVETDKIVMVTENDINDFKSVHSGKVYEKVPLSIPCAETSFVMESGKIVGSLNYNYFYCLETNGVLICDEDYLNKTFGVDGKVKLLAGSLFSEDSPETLIITDYIADSIINYHVYVDKDASYESLINLQCNRRGKIGGIIYTGYKEKYGDYIEKVKSRQAIDKAEAAEFVEYADTYLNVAYTINPDFVEAFATSDHCTLGKVVKSKIAIDADTVIDINHSYHGICYTNHPEKSADECSMGNEMYYEFFGETVTPGDENFVPRVFTIYLQRNGSEEIYDSITLTVTEIISGANVKLYDRQLAERITRCNLFTYELYFDEPESVSGIFNVGEENDFYVADEYCKTVNSITKIVVIFHNIFTFIAAALCGVMVLLMASFAFGNIRSRNYEIGVMRAMGAGVVNVAGIFLIQIVLMGISICVMFGLLFYYGMPYANDILMDGIVEYVNNASVTGIKLLSFDSGVMWSGLGIIVGVTVISALAPFIGVLAIKPVNIIKAKD